MYIRPGNYTKLTESPDTDVAHGHVHVLYVHIHNPPIKLHTLVVCRLVYSLRADNDDSSLCFLLEKGRELYFESVYVYGFNRIITLVFILD